MIIYNGKILADAPKFIATTDKAYKYRALVELNNKLCIIACDKAMPYSDFTKKLLSKGAKHAIYLVPDEFGFYQRNNNGVQTTTTPIKTNTYNNYIVFRN